MSSKTYTLVSYNTSWVNDCNDNQLHPGLSESASIVAKANEMGKIVNVNGVKTFIDEEKPNLNGLRMALADTATTYINSKMAKGADFIALIEQMIHVPKGSHANYDAFGNAKIGKEPPNKQDIGDNNNNFGILRRINTLGLNDASVDGLKPGYNVVYDMIENYTLPTGGGEGIGIAFKYDLMDTILEWNKTDQPVVQKLNNGSIIPTQNVITYAAPVHYYSDDLGQVLCFDENGKQIYYNAGGKAADLGRPIIMTAGVKGTDTLNILVAAHGPNIYNLKFDTIDENGNPVQKQIKDVLYRVKDAKSNITSKDYTTEVNTLFETVRKSISRFITTGLNSVVNKGALSSVTTVNVFFGGDMNDPRGQLLESILINGFEIQIGDKPYSVKFNYTLGNRKVASTIDESQYGYEQLLSCCANTDSVKSTNDTKSRKPTLGAVGPIKPERIDNYPVDFHKPENFGYNGDYALFGSTLESSSTLSIDNASQQIYEENGVNVIASDHLPVVSIATVNETQPQITGGKRRTAKKRPKRTRRRGHRQHKRTAKK
jgi:hypothetical protein